MLTAHDTPVMADAQELLIKFRSIFLQFSKYHSLYDCTTITPDMIKCLGKCLIYELFNAQGLDEAIKMLYATLDSTFNWGHEENCKNGSLEDHIVDWLSSHQAGCGLMGEQGAESIMLHSTP